MFINLFIDRYLFIRTNWTFPVGVKYVGRSGLTSVI